MELRDKLIKVQILTRVDASRKQYWCVLVEYHPAKMLHFSRLLFQLSAASLELACKKNLGYRFCTQKSKRCDWNRAGDEGWSVQRIIFIGDIYKNTSCEPDIVLDHLYASSKLELIAILEGRCYCCLPGEDTVLHRC